MTCEIARPISLRAGPFVLTTKRIRFLTEVLILNTGSFSGIFRKFIFKMHCNLLYLYDTLANEFKKN